MINQKFDQYLKNIWITIGNANKYVDEQAPWSLKKSDFSRMEDVLYNLLETIRQISILLQPFMPESSKTILDHIKLKMKTGILSQSIKCMKVVLKLQSQHQCSQN